MFSLTHVDNETLLEDFKKVASRDRLVTAVLLAHIAEIDHRHLYLREGFESMKAYCMARLQLTEDAAAKRIQVARLARELPVLFPAIADGRLHMKAVRMLAPHVNRGNVAALIEAATNKSATDIELELAKRFPQPELLRLDDGISPQVVVRHEADPISHAPGHAKFSNRNDPPAVRTKLAPRSAERYSLEVTLPAAMHDRLRHAQKLLGHTTSNLVEVLDRGLVVLIKELEKRKFGVGARRVRSNVRGIPGKVKNAVYKNDGGRCSIRLEDGTRCNSDDRIEFDHIIPRAKGGPSTVDNLRLVCRAHNVWAAEQEFGRDFMTRKRCKNK